MRGIGIALGAAALAFSAQPALAKDADPAAMDKAMASMADMFKAEPLTAEQQERLPQASRVVDQMMPPGTLGEVMSGMFSRIIDPIVGKFAKPSSQEVARNLGVEADDLHLSGDQVAEVTALIDPAAEQRNQATVTALKSAMGKAMTVMEPPMRQGMSEAFAVDFDTGQLGDIQSFFATSSGSAFAKKFFTMSTDPHVLGAMMKSLPMMMQALGGMEKDIKAAAAGIPAPRTWDELSAAQRARLAQLTGLSQARLKAGMAEAATQQAAKDTKAAAD